MIDKSLVGMYGWTEDQEQGLIISQNEKIATIKSEHHNYTTPSREDGELIEVSIGEVHVIEHQSHIISRIMTERDRQDAKFGDQTHKSPLLWMAILMEEVGEAARGHMDNSNYEKEMIEVAAVAVAALEALYEQRARQMRGENSDG